MAATRAEDSPQLVRGLAELDMNLRSALISCLEALVPHLEPGWSHCRDHPGCLAVQEASGVLWGAGREASVPPPSPVEGPVAPAPFGTAVPVTDPKSAPPAGKEPLMSPEAPSGSGP